MAIKDQIPLLQKILEEEDKYVDRGVLFWHAAHPRACRGANYILGEHGDICVCIIPYYYRFGDKGEVHENLRKAREVLKEIEKRRGWIEYYHERYKSASEDWERQEALKDIEDEEERIAKDRERIFYYLQEALLEAEPKWRLRYSIKNAGARYASEVYAALYTSSKGLHEIERVAAHQPQPLPKGEVYVKDTEQNRAVILAAAARVCEKLGWDFKLDDKDGFRLVKRGGAWIVKMFWEYQRLYWGKRAKVGHKFYYKLRQLLIHHWHRGWLECSEPHRKPVCLWVKDIGGYIPRNSIVIVPPKVKEKSGWLFPDGSYKVLGEGDSKPKDTQTLII